ncbi:glycoprotease family protein [Rutstroemia sp. NJR-2017a BVV2]|nr:glycoprotease family protein [Rutstroemia sp. NJR-2017a BVV2]PQE18529.1 glycoprotease family protein [Rutstroemia sp. NJR-2017a BVV2]
MNTKDPIISRSPTGRPPAQSTNSYSTEPTENPFNSVFDGEDSDGDSWRDEEDISTSTSPKGLAPQNMQWPKNPERVANNRSDNLGRTMSRRNERRQSVHRLTREKSKARQRKIHAKLGIKVQTNFSTHHGPQPQPISTQPPRSKPTTGPFVNMAALEALENVAAHPDGTFWKSLKNKRLRGNGASPEKNKVQEPMNNAASAITPLVARRKSLKPAPLKLGDDLSPNDRPIVIGISIPSARLAQHVMTPQTATTIASTIARSYGNDTPIGRELVTPSIVITPANEISAWSPYSTASNVSRARTFSTSYSIASPTDPFKNGAPPLPSMPIALVEQERYRVAAAERSYFSPDSDVGTEWEEESRSSRVISSCIVFEEDNLPIIVRSRRAISFSEGLKIDRHGSINTIASRPRSKGWWNYITTPFLTRSNTFAFPEKTQSEVPEVPILAMAAAKAQASAGERKSWEKMFSPLSIKRSNSNASDAWWDVTPLGFKSEKRNSSGSPTWKEARHSVKPYVGSLPFVISSTASMRNDSSPSTISAQPHDESSTLSSSEPISIHKENSVTPEANRTIELGSNNPFVQSNRSDLYNASNVTRSAGTDDTETDSSKPAMVRDTVDTPPPPPPYSPSPKRVRKYKAFFPPGHTQTQTLQYPVSPGPISPGMQHAMASPGSVQMSEVPLTPAQARTNQESAYPGPNRQPTVTDITQDYLQKLADKAAKKAEKKRQRNEKVDKMTRKAGSLWAGRGCIPRRGCHGRGGPEGRKRRKWYCFLFIGLLMMIILIVALATTLTRKHHTTTQTQWLNLTGFPPIYSGLSTVAAPVNVVSQTGCVLPATKWSCSLPKEAQSSVSPNQPDQPNFVLNIQWDNSSAANATFANVTGDKDLATRSLVGNPVSAGTFIRDLILKARQTITFSPSPSAPSYSEEAFLGNTTDGIVSSNKAGEPTPFYISFLSTINTTLTVTSRLKRDATNDTVSFPNITDIIPGPDINPDGTAASANLLPLPTQQPIRLYDRGLPTEHYGFYTYFNRTIFLKSLNTTTQVPDDQDGGSRESEANFRCTWSETRFLVQMWTRMNGTARLINSTSTAENSRAAAGQDFSQPGSFPYPITITTDRHGGDPAKKLLYCYKMDNSNKIVSGSGFINEEDRSFGGTLINPAPSVFTTQDPSASFGGFDGGTGGCACSWENWQKVTSTN